MVAPSIKLGLLTVNCPAQADPLAKAVRHNPSTAFLATVLIIDLLHHPVELLRQDASLIR
jgi:hypothetical protein